MPKSRTDKSHKDRLAKYKANKKRDQELLKKKMIENLMKIQQEQIANKQEHTSTEEVVGSEIDLDGLTLDEKNIDLNINPEIVNIEESVIVQNNNNL